MYMRNRISDGPIIDNKIISPCEAYYNKTPSIDHLRIWGCRVFLYVKLKSLPGRKNKLIDRGRLGIFLSYTHTTRQYKIWALDMKRVIRTSNIVFNESKSLTTEELQLEKVFDNNILPVRNAVSRPKNVKKPAVIFRSTVLNMGEKDCADNTPVMYYKINDTSITHPRLGDSMEHESLKNYKKSSQIQGPMGETRKMLRVKILRKVIGKIQKDTSLIYNSRDKDTPLIHDLRSKDVSII